MERLARRYQNFEHRQPQPIAPDKPPKLIEALDPLALFGVVYFDELVAFTPNGNRSLLNGVATTMTYFSASTLAIPQRISDLAFKVIRR